MKRFIKYYFFAFITLLVLLHPEETIRYARASTELCIDVLYPSLFPFFVCSGLLVYSGFCECMAKFFSPVMKPLFNVRGGGAGAFCLGIISGYPIGAEVACKLYDNKSVTKNECERLMAFCNNSGPLFILGTVGVSMYHSPKVGAMLYFVHILSAVTVGIIFRFFSAEEITKKEAFSKTQEELSIAEVFSKALKSSVKSILTVCGCVIFFAVISNLVADLIPESIWRTLFVAFAELTGGIKTISDSQLSLGIKLILSAVATGFAGLCVHLQVMSVANGRGLSLKPYIIGKLLHAGVSAVYMYILLQIFPVTRAVFAKGASVSGAFFAASVFTAGSVLLILLISGTVLTACFIKKKCKVQK